MAPRLKVTDDDLSNLTEAELAGMKELQEEEQAALAAGADDEEEGDDDAGAEEDKKPDKKAAAEKDENSEAAEKKDKKGEAEKDEKGAENSEKEEKTDAEDAGEGEGEGEEGDAGEGEEDDDPGEGEEDGKKPEKVADARLPPYQMSSEELARLATVEKELDAIAEKFDDGELTAKEMREQSKVLERELDELKEKRTIAKMHGADASTRWYGQTIPAFMADHTEYKKGSLRFELLDQTVKRLQAASNDPTDPAILVEAHKQIVGEFGEVGKPKKEEKTNGKTNGRTIPPTLSGVPASDITESATKSEFAQLERLKGTAHEKALAKLSPDARERYLMGG